MNQVFSVTSKLNDAASAPARNMAGAFASMASSFVRSMGSMANASVRFAGLAGRVVGVVGLVGAALAVVSAVSFVRNLKAAANESEQYVRRSQRLRVSAGFLREIGFAAEEAGLGAESLFSALEHGRESMLEFERTGGGPAAEAIARLGLNVRNAKGELRSMQELLPEIADGLSRIGGEGERKRLAEQLLGSGDQALLDLLGRGAGGLEELQALYRAFGDTLTDVQDRNLTTLSRSFRLMALTARRGRAEFAAELAPFAADIVQQITAGMRVIPEVVRRARDLLSEARDASTPRGAWARDAVEDLLGSMTAVVTSGVREMVMLAAITAGHVGVAAIRSLGPPLTKAALDLVVDIGGAMTRGVTDTASTMGHLVTAFANSTNDLAGPVERTLRSVGSTVVEVSGKINAATRAGDFFVKSANTGIVQDLFGPEAVNSIHGGVKSVAELMRANLKPALSEIQQAGSDAFKAIRGDLGQLGETANRTLGVTELYAQALSEIRTAADDAAASVREAREELERPSSELFLEGMRTRLKEMETELEDAFRQGYIFAENLATTISGSLSRAFGDAVTGAKSFDKAVREMASNVLASISQLIFQLLTVRALLAVFSGFGGAAAGAGGLDAVSASAQQGFRPVVGLAKGGVARGPIAFAMASMMGSALPAAADGMLLPPTPGGTLLRAAEAGEPEAVMPLRRTRDGRLGVEAAGGGATVTFSPVINVHVSGGGEGAGAQERLRRDSQLAGREAAAAFIDRVRRDPDLRAQLRGALQ